MNISEEQLLRLIKKIISNKIPFFTNIIELFDKKVIYNRDQWYHTFVSRLIFEDGTFCVELHYDEEYDLGNITLELSDDRHRTTHLFSFESMDLELDVLSFILSYGKNISKICSGLSDIIPISVDELIEKI